MAKNLTKSSPPRAQIPFAGLLQTHREPPIRGSQSGLCREGVGVSCQVQNEGEISMNTPAWHCPKPLSTSYRCIIKGKSFPCTLYSSLVPRATTRRFWASRGGCTRDSQILRRNLETLHETTALASALPCRSGCLHLHGKRLKSCRRHSPRTGRPSLG